MKWLEVWQSHSVVLCAQADLVLRFGCKIILICPIDAWFTVAKARLMLAF